MYNNTETKASWDRTENQLVIQLTDSTDSESRPNQVTKTINLQHLKFLSKIIKNDIKNDKNS